MASTEAAHSMTPDSVTRTTNASAAPRLVSVVAPNVAWPRNSPVTNPPPIPSATMPLARSSNAPPRWVTQAMTPNRVTCITNASELRLASDLAPNVAFPEKAPVTRAPPTPSFATP